VAESRIGLILRKQWRMLGCIAPAFFVNLRLFHSAYRSVQKRPHCAIFVTSSSKLSIFDPKASFL